jgi:hypothetical protein
MSGHLAGTARLSRFWRARGINGQRAFFKMISGFGSLEILVGILCVRVDEVYMSSVVLPKNCILPGLLFERHLTLPFFLL